MTKQASKKSPLQTVKDEYGSKDKLVEKVASLLEPGEDEDKDEFAARLKHVANSKLLHLVAVAAELEALGGREALTKKVAELKGQAKDEDFVTRLGSLSHGELIGMHKSLTHRAAGKASKPTRSVRKQRRGRRSAS